MTSPDHSGGPIGEEVHLPGPSIQPLLITVGITLTVVGVTFNIALVIFGLALTLWQAVRWIRDCRGDVDELPLEH